MADRSSKVVLFGASGFIGSHIASELADHSAYSVASVPRAVADLADRAALRAVIGPGDVVVNAAGYAAATDRSAAAMQRFELANVQGVSNLADAAASARARQLVHVSSVAAMGWLSGLKITESASGPISSPYAVSKRQAEMLLGDYRDSLGVTILRPTSVFGEGRGLAHMLCKIASLPLIPLPGGGEAHIPYTYVGNVAQAVALAVGREECFGRTFIVGDKQSYSLREILAALSSAMDRKPVMVRVPEALAEVGVRTLEQWARVRGSTPLLDRSRLRTLTTSVSYSIDAFVEATGYQPRTSLKQSAALMVAWYLSQRRR
jgi:nucleoside-diphosphate-sugar epimerase